MRLLNTKTRRDNFKKKCFDLVVTNYKKIPKDKIIEADFAMGNGDCHNHCVAAVNSGRADSAWLVWGGNDDGVVHFINSKNGKFFDETWSSGYRDYHIIRKVDPSDFDNTVDLLLSAKRFFARSCGGIVDNYIMKDLSVGWI